MMVAAGAITRIDMTAMARMVSPLVTPKATTNGPSVACTVAFPKVDRPINSFSLLFKSDLVRFRATIAPIIRARTPIRMISKPTKPTCKTRSKLATAPIMTNRKMAAMAQM